MNDDRERQAELLAVDGLLQELARAGDGPDDRFVRRVLSAAEPRPRSTVKIVPVSFFTAAAAAVLAVGAWLAWPARVPVRIVSGTVSLAAGDRVVASEGQEGAVELSDRSLVRVRENTELVVHREPVGLKVELQQGAATFEIAKKPPGRQFAVATVHGEIVVHGTTFTATVDEGSLVVRVEEGVVDVRNAHGQARLLAGEHAVVSQDRPPDKKEKLFAEPLSVEVPAAASDPELKIDYPIVYVRARRAGDDVHKRFYTDFSQPVTMEPGADLMLLHPDGREERLVEGGKGGVTDPMVSLDGEWVYYSYLYDLEKANPWSPPAAGADLFKIHLKTRRIVRLTNQAFTPNAGMTGGERPVPYGVFNMGPCPLPDGRIVYTSNRDGFRPSKGYPAIALQLFVMDDRDEDLPAGEAHPDNLEKIGHLNIAGALHPVVLADGRIMFSSLESQGIRSEISWGIWTIHPDGANWAPMVSAFDPGGASNGFHFQTQLSDGSVIVEEYYNQNNSGFGAYVKLPPQAGFGPAYMRDARNVPWRFGRHDNGKGRYYTMPFMPTGSVSFTPFSRNDEGPADRSLLGDKASPAVGKFTHPSGAPDNHLLTVYSPGPVNHQYKYLPQLDGGIYLVKSGKTVLQPSDLRLIKNDPAYNESWPRAVVPYERIYGVKAPARIPAVANDGRRSPHLPEGTPFGLVGSSSLYKRESYPNGVVPPGSVTAAYAGGRDPWKGLDAFTSHGNGMPLNWHNQGADAGLYENAEIHALRILVMEPTTDRRRGPKSGRRFHNHATERLRILGEIPVRKGEGVTDPDGHPDTSFLAKIPADTAFTFQTIDKDGVVLNASQTWHQVRPGEVRTDCGGCHAHSQAPTLFEKTAAARPDYDVWDLTKRSPLLGAREEKKPADVEYKRDVRPILQRSCVPCHTKAVENPPGKLVLDADDELISVENKGKFPGTYVRLALDEKAKYGHKPVGYDSWGYPNASRYVRKMQSRRSLLAWKIFGRRMDGFSNDDHPSEPEPGAGYFVHRGQRVEKSRHYYDLDYVGSPMPPSEAVAGTYVAGDGRVIKVPPLSDEDRRTIVRWIDLGCPIDLDEGAPVVGWFGDDQRPIVAATVPADGPPRILLGLHDVYSGLDLESLRVTSDRPIDGVPAGENLAPRFREASPGVRRMDLASPWPGGTLRVSVRDRQGNETVLKKAIGLRP